VTSLWARTPLRVRLVVALVLLALLGLVVSGFAATTALRGYLVDRVDQQLQAAVHDRVAINGILNGYVGDGDGPGRPDAFGVIFVQFVPADGSPASSSPLADDVAAPRVPARAHKALQPYTVSATPGDMKWRVIDVPASRGGGDGTLFVAVPLDEVQHTVGRLRSLEAFIGAAVLLLLAVGGSLVVRRSLRPLVAVESAAEAIAEGDLSQRVPESDPRTEVGSLSQSFNTMVARLETAFTEQAASEA